MPFSKSSNRKIGLPSLDQFLLLYIFFFSVSEKTNKQSLSLSLSAGAHTNWPISGRSIAALSVVSAVAHQLAVTFTLFQQIRLIARKVGKH